MVNGQRMAIRAILENKLPSKDDLNYGLNGSFNSTFEFKRRVGDR
jgi:hypothetical protein